MAGIASIPLQRSVPTLSSSPPSVGKPARRLSSSSSSPCTLSLSLFSKRPAGRSRAVSVSVRPVARYGSGGGGFRPGPGSGESRRFPGSRSDSSDSDDAGLDISRITSSSVRLIDEQQNMVGVVSLEEARQRAEDAELDLVILSADADPPVLRMVDYNKYRYEQQKKKKDQQKKSTASRMDIKEVKMGYNINSHDYTVRLKAAQRFLKDGDKVKVMVNLKRRENDFKDVAIDLLKRFQDDVGELATEESKNFSDKNIFIVLLPNKAVLRKALEQPKKKEAPAPEVSASVVIEPTLERFHQYQ